MLKNHFKVALRNIRRDKSYAIINVIGLSTSMAIGLLVMLFLIDHGSMDEHIPEVDKVYRVMTSIDYPEKQRSRLHAYAPHQIKALLTGKGFTFSEETTLKKVAGTARIGEKAIGFKGLSVDPQFLDFFHFGGDPGWLDQPRQVVLSRELAHKLFGPDDDIVGSSVEISGVGPCVVTGLVGQLPRSHIEFELLVSMESYPRPSSQASWLSSDNRYVHYVRLSDEVVADQVQAYMSTLNAQLPAESRALNHFTLQPVSEINLGAPVNDELSTTIPWFVAVFLEVLGLIVILSASFNFVSLSLARSLKKAKEVGVRKILGSAKRQIIIQFLIETQLLAFISLVVAIALLSFLLPAFNELKVLRDINGQVTMDISTNLNVYMAFVLFAVAIGLIAGIYPALYMSRMSAQAALRGARQGGQGPFYLIRNSLLLIQFTFTVIFVMTTLVLSRQAALFVQTDYEFEHRELAFVAMEGYDREQLRIELAQRSGVQSYTFSSALPALDGISKVRAIRPELEADIALELVSADEQFLQVIEVRMVAGIGFNALGTSSRSEGLIISERALKALQFDNHAAAIGQSIEVKLNRETEATTAMKIIGVCQDFQHNFAMVEPKGLIITYQPDLWKYAVINLGQTDRIRAEKQLSGVLANVNDNVPVDVQWFDITLSDAYDEFYDIAHIFTLVSFLAIVIANLGQYGAIIQVINNRVKEIGIRKVLGSSYLRLMLLLSRSFMIIMCCATFVGSLIGIWINQLWLSEINKPTTIDTSLLMVSLAITSIAATLTVGWNVYRASMLNPVDAIRTD